MDRKPWAFAALVAGCALALGACSKQVDTNANAPGSPGTGHTAEVVKPAAPDGPPGGPSGIAGSAPHAGASGGDVLPGTTGSGTMGAAAQNAQPGVGLNGGLNADKSSVAGSTGTDTSTTSAPSGTAAPGSTNNTPGSAVGTR